MNHIGQLAQNLQAIPLAANKVFFDLAKIATPVTTIVTPKIATIYQSTIGNTISGTILSTALNIALKTWNFTVLGAPIAQIVMGCGSLYLIHTIATLACSQIRGLLQKESEGNEDNQCKVTTAYNKFATILSRENGKKVLAYTALSLLVLSGGHHAARFANLVK